MSKHTQCIVANTGDLNMQKELVEPSSDRVCRVLFPDVLVGSHLKKQNNTFINSYDQLYRRIKLSNMVPKCRWHVLEYLEAYLSSECMCFHGCSGVLNPNISCSSVVDNSSSALRGASYTVHASAHLGKVHVWSSGSWAVEAQVSCSNGLARGFDAGERREDLLRFRRFSCQC